MRLGDARPGFAGPYALSLIVLVTTPLWIREIGLYQYIAVEIVIWALFALSYNLLLGQAGLPSFGHGAFFGVGAYAFGLAVKQIAPNLWLGLGVALAAAALTGALVAAFISHRRGIYYALMTIAFGQVLWFVAIKWHSVTGGEDGLLGIARPPVDLGVVAWSLRSNEALFYFAVALFAVVTAFLWQLQDTPFGRVMAAIKGNEERARYCGHAVWLSKFTSFVLSAALAGLAGALFAMAQNSAYPNVMSLHNSGFVVMMVLDRRRAGQLLGAGHRRGLLHPRARPARRDDGGLAAVVRAAVHGGRAVQARRHRRCVANAAPAGANLVARRLMALLEARELHHRFGHQVVLDGVSLSFDEGTLSGIIGPNGAGKTTCFNVLTGRYRPNRGQVIFDGDDITGRSPAAIARRGIARSFQLMNLFDALTAIDNVIVATPALRRRAFRPFGAVRRDAELHARAVALLADVGLSGREHALARDLAYGDRRRLEIAVALAAEPRLLFLDEPTAGMGAEGARQLAALIERLRARVTIVIIEHDMRFLFSLADRISVIQWGQVIAEGTPAELRADPWVARSNLGAIA